MCSLRRASIGSGHGSGRARCAVRAALPLQPSCSCCRRPSACISPGRTSTSAGHTCRDRMSPYTLRWISTRRRWRINWRRAQSDGFTAAKAIYLQGGGYLTGVRLPDGARCRALPPPRPQAVKCTPHRAHARCPYATFAQFYNYYGDLDYGDKWVVAALDGTALTFSNEQVSGFAPSFSNFALTYTNTYWARVQAASNGVVFLGVWMYVIRQFEHAIDECSTSSADSNSAAVHEWDVGVAYWVGSGSRGLSMYGWADTHCQSFGTCGSQGNSISGTAKVNLDLLSLYNSGQSLFRDGACSAVRPILTQIIAKMTIPLIQGALKYAYRVRTYGPSGSGSSAPLLRSGTMVTPRVTQWPSFLSSTPHPHQPQRPSTAK